MYSSQLGGVGDLVGQKPQDLSACVREERDRGDGEVCVCPIVRTFPFLHTPNLLPTHIFNLTPKTLPTITTNTCCVQ